MDDFDQSYRSKAPFDRISAGMHDSEPLVQQDTFQCMFHPPRRFARRSDDLLAILRTRDSECHETVRLARLDESVFVVSDLPRIRRKVLPSRARVFQHRRESMRCHAATSLDS